MERVIQIKAKDGDGLLKLEVAVKAEYGATQQDFDRYIKDLSAAFFDAVRVAGNYHPKDIKIIRPK